MSQAWWLLIPVFIAAAAAAAYARRPLRRAPRAARLVQAKRRFHLERERLEAKFIQLLSARGKSEAQRWTDCTFADDVAYVRDRTSGELSAFVAMTVATEGADHMPREESEGHPQAGTAVFRFDRDHWVTDGRAILNLSPSEAVHYFGDDLEIVGEEFPQHA
jgi:hypothetical protein